MPASKQKFQENEKVLCFHGPLLYEAKCLQIKNTDNKFKYFVHYQGWNKSWDEWVPEDRVYKINAENLKQQKELEERQRQSNKQNKSAKKKPIEAKDVLSPNVSMGSTDKTKPKLNTSVTSVSNSLTPIQSDIKENPVVVKDSDVQRKKRRIETTVEHEDSGAIKKLDIKIKIPDSLKQILVNDWDQIRQKKLIRLPQKVTVDRILNDYLKHKNSTKLSASKQSSITEAVNGIKEYFKTTIGTQLLYKFEKNQFNEHIKDPDDDSTKASAIYGAIHLLRLFVKLEGLLSCLNLDDKSITLISGHIHDFLKYLESNPSLFNSNDYETASAEYLKKIS